MAENQSKSKILRGKMIGFMYLIFIVLALIYIPSDFIDSIRFLNTSLENSSLQVGKANEFNLNFIKSALLSDTLIDASEEITKLENIHTLSLKSYNALEILKSDVYKNSGGINSFGYFKNARESQFTDEIFFDNKEAEHVRKILEQFKIEIVDETYGITKHYLDSLLPTSNVITTASGKEKSWEKFYFHKMPLIVTMSIVSKFQNDIRSLEATLTTAIVDEIREKYDIEFVDIKKKEEELQKKLKNDSLKKPQEKKKEEEKEKKKPEFFQEAHIENTDLIVLYIGVYNPLKIYHPKAPTLNISATISQGDIIKKDSLFYAKVDKPGIVEISAFSQNTLIAKRKFEVKNLPVPSVVLGDRNGGKISSKIFKVQKSLNINTEIVSAQGKYSIKTFSLTRINAEGEIQKSEENKGAFLNSITADLINQSQRGDLYIFDDIEAEGPDGTILSLASLVYKIN